MPLNLTSLTYLAFQLNCAMSRGHGDTFTFDELYSAVEANKLWSMLEAKVPDIDVGILHHPDLGKDQGEAIVAALGPIITSMRTRERRKYGIAQGGPAILLAYVIELIQQGWK